MRDSSVIVIVPGLPRSGTTWIFNVVINVLQDCGSRFESRFIDKLDDEAASLVAKNESKLKVSVVKTHDHTRLSAFCDKFRESSILIFVPIRSYFGLSRSRRRVFGDRSADALNAELKVLNDALAEISAPFYLISDFSMFLVPSSVVAKIAREMGTTISWRNKRAIARSLRPKSVSVRLKELTREVEFDAWHDEHSQYHADHIQNPNPLSALLFGILGLSDEVQRDYSFQARSLKELYKKRRWKKV